MRIAALDVGEARIGVAVSDELGITAQGLGVVRRVGGRRDLEALGALLAPYAPSRLVVGLPLDMRGTEGARARLRRAGGRAPGSPARVLGRALDDGRGGARTPRGGREPAAAARGRRQGGRDAHPPGLPRAPAVIRLLAAGAVLAAAAAVVAFVLVLRAPGPPRPAPVTVTLEEGERFAEVAEDLRRQGVLRHPL